jgi:archaellum component FlaC
MLNNVLETTTMTTNGNTQPDRIDQMMALLSGFIEETREFMAEQKQFNAKVTEDISRLTDQVGQLITQVNGLPSRRADHPSQ